MASEGSYYVPEQSKFPLFASIGLFFTVFGAANLINNLNLRNPKLESAVSGGDIAMLVCGLLFFIFILWNWFGTAIRENLAGMNSAQLKRSYVWGMFWFIFSEVMFFAAFFGALFYLSQLAGPWLAGAGANFLTGEVLNPGFEFDWPLMTTPDMVANAENADKIRFQGPGEAMGWTGLPLINTILLLSSSVTVHFAHVGLKNDNKKVFNVWLFITIALAIVFLGLQVEEYYHAYTVMDLKLTSGTYGTTFFMLTGFHGFHVFLGMTMLLIMWLRSVIKGHFKHDDCFGFEAASWYWHFVDVVWVGLFLFVYILGGA